MNMTHNHDTEDALESAVRDLFQSLSYEVINAYDEISGVNHMRQYRKSPLSMETKE
jgi:hypothetical protein